MPGLTSFPTRRSSDLAERRRREPRAHRLVGAFRRALHEDVASKERVEREIFQPFVREPIRHGREERLDRKSTRLNSSHTVTSYAVFFLKKKRDHFHES